MIYNLLTAVQRYGRKRMIHMTVTTDQSQVNTSNEVKNQEVIDNKEKNFRALEAKYRRELEQERAARIEAERLAKEAQDRRQAVSDDDDDDNEPYVEKRKLNRKLEKFGQSTQGEIQKAMEHAKHQAKEELKQELWLESNPDFFDTLQHADKFAQKAPKLAETILKMPDSFERQKLVYQNIKALGIDKPEAKAPSIQDKINANARTPGYQPNGFSGPGYQTGGDFSAAGQKNAYDKLKELKQRIGG